MSTQGERHLWVWYSPYGIGGVETYLLNMAREIKKDGGKVWIAATSNSDGPLRQSYIDAGLNLLDWSAYHAAYVNDRSPEGFQRNLTADLARIKPTLVALNDCNDFSTGTAPMLRRIKQYCTILDTFHIDSPVDQYLDFRRGFVDALDGIAATNENVINKFRCRYPNHSSLEMRYIRNGVTVSDRERTPHNGILRLIYVGRLVQDQKRILDLPPLLQSLLLRGKEFTATIVGEGPCREALEIDLRRRGLGDRVQLTGYLQPSEVFDLYFKNDVLINLSTFEGFSMSVLEAFAAGCVPVCTDVESLDRKVFQDGVNCRLCPVDSLDRMVDIWSKLTPLSLQQLSSAARATGRRFTAKETYLEYRDFVASLRKRRPLRPWPEDAESVLKFEWDLIQHNSSLSRANPLRRLGSAAWTRVTEALKPRPTIDG